MSAKKIFTVTFKNDKNELEKTIVYDCMSNETVLSHLCIVWKMSANEVLQRVVAIDDSTEFFTKR